MKELTIQMNKFIQSNLLSAFLRSIEDDPRIGITHIVVYVALLQYWKDHGYPAPLFVFSYEIMSIVKISTRSTYYKIVHELNDYGYIRLETSRKRNQGSKVYFQTLEIVTLTRNCPISMLKKLSKSQ